MSPLTSVLDGVLRRTTESAGGVPGVVTILTDRQGTIHEGSAGVRAVGSGDAMTPDTILSLFSCTKAITGVALMQCVEDGLVSLDDRADRHVPEISRTQVLDGFDADGTPRLRPPTTPITVRHLMLHTAGFGYEFFNADIRRYRTYANSLGAPRGTRASIDTPLTFDPGTRWQYGVNIDWVGLIIEAVRGQRLGQVFRERILDPLGMHDTAFHVTDAMADRAATMHQRQPLGEIIPIPSMTQRTPPQIENGGGGLYASAQDYAAFMRMILNDGSGAEGRILKSETVQSMVRNGLGDLASGGWISANPTLTNSGEYFPGIRKSWAYTFQVNDEPASTGRPAGSLAWAGLGNLFYWIDRQNGIAGFWGTQILPFHDISSYPGFVEFETTVYQYLSRNGTLRDR